MYFKCSTIANYFGLNPNCIGKKHAMPGQWPCFRSPTGSQTLGIYGTSREILKGILYNL